MSQLLAWNSLRFQVAYLASPSLDCNQPHARLISPCCDSLRQREVGQVVPKFYARTSCRSTACGRVLRVYQIFQIRRGETVANEGVS